MNVLTLYADLDQSVRRAQALPASISRKIVDGMPHLYAVEKHGAARIQRYLGPERNVATAEEAREIRAEATQARLRRKTIGMIKRAGLPGPPAPTAKVLEALSRAGFFNSGLVLVGTCAFQLYPPLLGHALSTAAATTQDIDVAVASVVDTSGDADLGVVLKRADPTFRPLPGLDRKALPKRFVADSGLEVEVLTPVRTRADDGVVNLPRIGAGAVPLQYLNYLIEDAVEVVALAGSGFLVKVPQPARYAVHKLLVAQQRQPGSPKRPKDLLQAEEIMAVLRLTDPDVLEDAVLDAAGRGPKWRSALRRAGLSDARGREGAST